MEVIEEEEDNQFSINEIMREMGFNESALELYGDSEDFAESLSPPMSQNSESLQIPQCQSPVECQTSSEIQVSVENPERHEVSSIENPGEVELKNGTNGLVKIR